MKEINKQIKHNEKYNLIKSYKLCKEKIYIIVYISTDYTIK